MVWICTQSTIIYTVTFVPWLGNAFRGGSGRYTFQRSICLVNSIPPTGKNCQRQADCQPKSYVLSLFYTIKLNLKTLASVEFGSLSLSLFLSRLLVLWSFPRLAWYYCHFVLWLRNVFRGSSGRYDTSQRLTYFITSIPPTDKNCETQANYQRDLGGCSVFILHNRIDLMTPVNMERVSLSEGDWFSGRCPDWHGIKLLCFSVEIWT